MPIKDDDVEKQLRHMMAFIEQEANEKAEEIDAKAEEEFNIEKGRLVQQQRTKILEYYEKKEKQVELQRKIQSSNMLNQGRLKCLKAREDHIRNVLDEAKSNLGRISGDTARYPSILKGLMMQVFLQLLETDCIMRCKQSDAKLVEKLLPECVEELRKIWGQTSKVTIDTVNWLNPESAGGVELSAKQGKIRVVATLESRLDLIASQTVPQIRSTLFGGNPNRKFFD